jgi:parvulin-like peptidyl-prolyl isomerase
MLAAGVLGVFLVAFFVVVAIAQGIGDPSVPSDDVAVVEDAPDGHVTTEEFQAALEQAAASGGAAEVPPPSNPQYAALKDSAMSSLLTARWVRGEAEERGITVSDTEIENQLDKFRQQFGGEKGFQQALKQAHFTAEDARAQAELVLLGNQVEAEVLNPDSPPAVSQSEIEDYYEANKIQFQQPESRDVRQIVNKDQAKVDQAKSQLEQDDSPASWKKVAAEFSTDSATKDAGGLRAGVIQGQDDPALEDQIFTAAQGALVGPFEGPQGFYLIQVVKVTPATTTPLADASKQISNLLAQGKQQQIAQDFQQDFTQKWTSRTFCGDDYLTSQCDNFTAPVQVPEGSAPVFSRPVVDPGKAAVFPGQEPQALSQGPVKPVAAAPPSIIGPGGAVPGAAPQGATPSP